MTVYELPIRLKRESSVKLGEKIKRLRKQRKLSQEQLAEQLEINSNHLSRLERGVFQPSVEVLKRLADTLEVTVDFLLSDSDQDSHEFSVADKNLLEKLRLISELHPADQDAIYRVIDSMLTKRRIQELLGEEIEQSG